MLGFFYGNYGQPLCPDCWRTGPKKRARLQYNAMHDIAQNYEKLAEREQTRREAALAVNSARRSLPPDGTPARRLVVDLSTVFIAEIKSTLVDVEYRCPLMAQSGFQREACPVWNAWT
jgi:hypothetical protein